MAASEIEELRKDVAALKQKQGSTYSAIPGPEPFSFVKEEWKPWIKHFERYRMAVRLDQEDEKLQINALLLHGTKGHEIP
ncbi:hypothetical protein QE152_g30465 [Popillia japonica]|uniref:Uncharacterized protein n=1 Tax=Popillia japonica TaxID=7064 RepID=A0AAW1JET7_POPJA